MKKYGFGVDLGGTTVKIGLFTNDGILTDKWEIPTNTDNNGASILDDITASLENKMTEAGISKDEIEGVGIDVPGPVKGDGTVCRCVNLGWGEFNVADVFSAKIGLPVKVCNDANAAALGEMWMGGGKGHENVVMVTLGTGVGGGIIVNGEVISGAHGAGGEIGHIKVVDNEPDSCGCGRHGCLEQYCSATGIVRVAKQKLAMETRDTVLKNNCDVSAKVIFDAAKSGDEVAVEIVDTIGHMLGSALSNISCIADPEVIVIGGGVSKAGQILIDVIQKYYVEDAFHACASTEFALALLGNDAGMYGCARMIFA